MTHCSFFPSNIRITGKYNILLQQQSPFMGGIQINEYKLHCEKHNLQDNYSHVTCKVESDVNDLFSYE